MEEKECYNEPVRKITLDEIKSGKLEEELKFLNLNDINCYASEDNKLIDLEFTKEAFDFLNKRVKLIKFYVIPEGMMSKYRVRLYHNGIISYINTFGKITDIKLNDNVIINATLYQVELKFALIFSKYIQKVVSDYDKENNADISKMNMF